MNIRYYEGRRIYLRPIELSDEPKLRQWYNDPGNWSTLARLVPMNELRETEYIRQLYKSPTDIALGIVARDDNRMIGSAGLHGISRPNRSATFGIIIGEREEQSKGYGTEATRIMLRYAFEELNLNRVSLTVYADNRRAIRAYRRAGFVPEGRARSAFYRNGRYHDELLFGILRSEWTRQDEQDGNGELPKETECEDEAAPAPPLASMTTWSVCAMV